MLNRRPAIVWLLAIAVAAFVLRNSVVQSFAGPNPARAAAAWPGHPNVLLSKGLTEIGLTKCLTNEEAVSGHVVKTQ